MVRALPTTGWASVQYGWRRSAVRRGGQPTHIPATAAGATGTGHHAATPRKYPDVPAALRHAAQRSRSGAASPPAADLLGRRRRAPNAVTTPAAEVAHETTNGISGRIKWTDLFCLFRAVGSQQFAK